MLLEVHQDVDQRVTDRAWGGQRARVIAAVPHPPPASERPVHGAREPDRETPSSSGKRATVPRLGEQMHVVVLDREMNDPEISVPGGSDGAAHGGEHARGAKTSDRLA